MKTQSIRRFSLMTAMLCGAIAWTTSGLVVAQEKDKEGAPAAKKKADSKGTLPAYYGDVVSGEQREKIYAVLAKYKDKIAKLKLEVDTLEAERNKEIEAVLTPDQQQKVAKAKTEAAAKAKAKKAENAKKKNGDATAAPAAATGEATKTGGAPKTGGAK